MQQSRLLHFLIDMEFETKTENIGKKIKICTSEDHTFGTDAILLFDFAKVKKSDRVCDIGTGCGIIGILAADVSEKETVGIDIQEKAVLQAAESARLSDLSNRFKPVLMDIKDINGKTFPERFTCVLCNPPYFKPSSGKIPFSAAAAIARLEIKCDIYDVACAAGIMLGTGGRFSVCHKPERTADVFDAMRKHGIEPKRMRFVRKSHTSEPWLVLVEGKKDGKAGLKIEEDLIITPGEENTDTYRRYKEEK